MSNLRHRLPISSNAPPKDPPVASKTLVHQFADIPQLTLNVNRSKITQITVKEGTISFAFWFIVSSYLPVFTACLCPLTNMTSIAALVTEWRSTDNDRYVSDSSTVYILNAISLALGCVGNISVVLNFGRRLPYKISQSISITCFYSASFFLLSACALAGLREIDGTTYRPTEGLWFAVITTILYFGCATTCLLNFTGALLKKYPSDISLTNSERGLIIYNFMLAVWFVWGAALFSTLNHISYGDGMYFCTVSLLTIGLGDIIPKTRTSKGLILVYSLSGLILLGLIVAMIRSMMNSTANPVLFWNSVERRRVKILDELEAKGTNLSQETAFDLMRSIRKEARRRQRRISSIITLTVFVISWLIGALIFSLVEHWDYFDAVYFCFLCLLTIGYGDFTPKSAAGKPVFIVWALAAVPLMTALISSTGDTIYDFAMSGVYLSTKLKIFQKVVKGTYEDENEMSEKDIDEDEERTVDQIIGDAERHSIDPQTSQSNTKNLFNSLRELLSESKEDPHKRYDYKQWNDVIQLLEIEDEDRKTLGMENNLFWLSDQSPLRFPISEPNYLFFLLFSKLEALVTDEAMDLLRQQNTRATEPTGEE